MLIAGFYDVTASFWDQTNTIHVEAETYF